MSFEFNQLSCSGQQIYFTADICNPVDNSYAPEITMDMEGHDGDNWVHIYRYKTGEIPYNSEQPWTQIVLPISRDSIMKYSSFRCRAELNGGPNKNCYVLIDRMRFIERSRAFTVFQNKATCVEDDSVTALIRLDSTSNALSGISPLAKLSVGICSSATFVYSLQVSSSR